MPFPWPWAKSQPSPPTIKARPRPRHIDIPSALSRLMGMDVKGKLGPSGTTDIGSITPIGDFAETIENGIVRPSRMFGYGQTSQEAEASLLWRSIIQAMCDILRSQKITAGATDADAKPDPRELESANALIAKANRFGQSLDDIASEIWEDAMTHNDVWAYCIRDYVFTGAQISQSIIKEVYRGDPALMRHSYTSDYGVAYIRCPVHWDEHDVYRPESPGQTCKVCGRVMLPVVAVALKEERGNTIDKYLIEGEVWHSGLYNTGRGFLYYAPHLTSFWRELYTLNYYRQYRFDALTSNELPDGILSITTRNFPGLMSWVKQIKAEMKTKGKKNPILPVDPGDGKGSNPVQYISLLDKMFVGNPTLEKDYRDRICGYYGVSPALISDVSASGGLNNESMQLSISKLRSSPLHGLIAERFLGWLKASGSYETVSFSMPPPWKEDKAAEQKELQGTLDIAKKFQDLGGSVSWNGKEMTLNPADALHLRFFGVSRVGTPEYEDHMGELQRLKEEISLASAYAMAGGRAGFDGQHATLSATPDLAPIAPADTTVPPSTRAAPGEPRTVGRINADLIGTQRAMELELSGIINDEIGKLAMTQRTKPTEAQLTAVVDDCVQRIRARMAGTSDADLRKMYKLGKELCAAEQDMTPSAWSSRDEAAVAAIVKDKDGIRSFLSNYAPSVREQVIGALSSHMNAEQFDYSAFEQDIKNVLKTASMSRVERVARTEFKNAVFTAKQNAYRDAVDRGDDIRVQWNGVLECEHCQAIDAEANATDEGVTPNELDDIVARNSPSPRGWLPHPNCLCAVTRKFPRRG